MSFNRFLAALNARNLEFLRDRTALGWNFIMPVLLVIGFALIFSSGDKVLYKVGVYGDMKNAAEHQSFLATKHIQFIPVDELQQAIVKVDRHQLELVLDLKQHRFWVNSTSPGGYIVEQLLNREHLTKAEVSGMETRYVDWVIPGIIGMNIMFSALFGIGYVIVRYRKNGVLKRLKATPLTAFEFLSAQIASRLLMIVFVNMIVFIGTDQVIHFQMHGSYWLLFLIMLLGSLSLISLGLLIAARMSSEEAANGLLNLLSWPMMLLSGVWFSLEGAHPAMHLLAQTLPLTHMMDAARSVMIEGADMMSVMPHLIFLLAFSALFILIGAKTFRWE